MQVRPGGVLATVAGVPVRGGFGSAVAAVPGRPGRVYLLTDRGPNVDLPDPDRKAFAVPDYQPRIGEFRRVGDRLEQTRSIPLRAADGHPLSGRPNPTGAGATGEVPMALDGRELATDPDGVDSEGLAAVADGSFWISDEYGPWLLHVEADGRVRERLGPFARAGRRLPAVLAARRPNRGMEGLTLLPGTATLAGLIQSPLDNPKAAGRRSRAVRLVLFDTNTGMSRQLVYLLDSPGNRTTEIAALSATRFLVIEIDGKVPGDPKAPSEFLRIFQVGLAGATDVSDSANNVRGRLFGDRTLEELDPDELAAAGVVPVRKTLVLDLLDPTIGYPFDKPEGLAVLDDGTIAIANDDDFGVDSDGKGGMVAKRLPGGRVVGNEVWFIKAPGLGH